LREKVENLEKELCGVYDKHIAAITPNPALENVLEKLREILPVFAEKDVDLNLIGCLKKNGERTTLTLGDLRRWAESEKANGVKNGWCAGRGGKALVQNGIIVATNPSIPEADKGIIGKPIDLSVGSCWQYIGVESEKGATT
jgi:hypothetical protein